MTRRPAQLSRFPGYAAAPMVQEVEQALLTPERFDAEHVRKNRPVLVRGAAAGWPACSAWTVEGLRERTRDVHDLFEASQGLLDRPLREYAGAVVGGERDAVRDARPTGADAHAWKFLDRLVGGEQLVAYALSLATSGFEPLRADLGDLSFAPRDRYAPPRMYESRLFLYRGGYTDWHFHYGDETLTVQLRGTKEMLLLPPDTATFRRLWALFRHRGTPEIDPGAFEGFTPLRAVLHPGDVLFVPVFWWHAVEPADDEIGATVAFTFASPPSIQYDLRYAAARWTLLYGTWRASVGTPLARWVGSCVAAVERLDALRGGTWRG